MTDIESELEELGEVIEEKKTAVEQNTGALKTLKKQLDTDFNIKTVAKAEAEISKLSKNIEITENRIKKSFDKLNEEYSW